MTSKRILAACALLAATALLWFTLQGDGKAGVDTLSYPAFQQEVLRDNVKSVTILQGSQAKGRLKTGAPFTVVLPADDPSIYDLLNAHNVTVAIRSAARPAWMAALFTFLPIVLSSWLLIGFLLGVGFYWGVHWCRRFMTGSTTGGL